MLKIVRLVASTIAFFAVFQVSSSYAQGSGKSLYTILQAGGMYGMQQSNPDINPMNGYQFQFIIGKPAGFSGTYLGLGIGNDVYRGSSTLSNGTKLNRKVNTLPLFLDARQDIANISVLGALGLMANAGYALPIGGDFYHGFMGKAGLTYGHLLVDKSQLLFSLGWGAQEFRARFLEQGNSFQQHFFLTIGLSVK
jgi:hypothetical protein